MLPIVVVQLATGPVTPALEDHLLRACSAGLERARCVSARHVDEQAPRGIAVVSWPSEEHALIEVGLAGGAPLWISRELDFASEDPEAERWRAVGFTIALLADDPRFWPELEAEPALEPPLLPPGDVSADVASAPSGAASSVLLELGGLTGSGVESGPLRWGVALGLSIPLGGAFFAVGHVDYALARDTALDVRWVDTRLGAGVYVPDLFVGLDARLRLELALENVAVTVRRGSLTERHAAWVPGVSVGGDLLWPVSEAWLLGARADAFWVDGSTGVESAGQRIGAVAGAGLVFGAGVGYRF